MRFTRYTASLGLRLHLGNPCPLTLETLEMPPIVAGWHFETIKVNIIDNFLRTWRLTSRRFRTSLYSRWHGPKIRALGVTSRWGRGAMSQSADLLRRLDKTCCAPAVPRDERAGLQGRSAQRRARLQLLGPALPCTQVSLPSPATWTSRHAAAAQTAEHTGQARVPGTDYHRWKFAT